MKSRGSSVRLVAAALLFISPLAGCVGESKSGDLVIEMGSFFYDPAELAFHAGQTVSIEVVNQSDVEHDIVVTSEVFEISFQAMEAIEDRPEIVVGQTDRVPAGESVSLALTFDEPREYQYFCTIFGHFYQGMRGTITVGA